MPIYEWECKKCGHVVCELRLSIKDKVENLACPVCGGELRKLISLSSFRCEKAAG